MIFYVHLSKWFPRTQYHFADVKKATISVIFLKEFRLSKIQKKEMRIRSAVAIISIASKDPINKLRTNNQHKELIIQRFLLRHIFWFQSETISLSFRKVNGERMANRTVCDINAIRMLERGEDV